MTEPDVALTDYALAVECFIFAAWLIRVSTPSKSKKIWSGIAFLSLGIASVIGGTVHGYFREETTMGYKILWPAALLSIGVTALASWILGAEILFSKRLAAYGKTAAIVAFGIYACEILFVNQSFRIAIFFYVPAILLILAASCHIYAQDRAWPALLGIAGILLSLLAPVMQQAGYSWPALHLNHNAVFHLFQGLSNAFVFLAVRWYLQTRRTA